MTARLWNIETAEVLRQFVGHFGGVQSIGFSADGSRIITGDTEAAYLWHAEQSDLVNFACSIIPNDLSNNDIESYTLERNQSICNDSMILEQVVEVEWTPHPPLPTALPLALAPMGEEAVFEFEFVPIPVQMIEVIGVPALRHSYSGGGWHGHASTNTGRRNFAPCHCMAP